jgi:hypothetical protein
MKNVNGIHVYEIDERVVWPDGWPELAAGKSRFGFKLIEKDGKKVWTDAAEADFRKTLTRYGKTEAEVDAAVSARMSADLGQCNWNGTQCVNQCTGREHCKGFLNIEDLTHTCWCEVSP